MRSRQGSRVVAASQNGDYYTNFPATEDPLSEGGIWQNAGTDGMPFGNFETTPNRAFADRFITEGLFDDSWAFLKSSFRSYNANQFAEATVYVEPGFAPSAAHEMQLLLRCSADFAGPFYFPCYEVLINHGFMGQIARQAGNMGGYTILDTSGSPGYGVLATGDVVRATISGSAINMYVNGVLGMTATDGVITSGQPGMGAFVRPGAGQDPTKYCFTDFRCGNL